MEFHIFSTKQEHNLVETYSEVYHSSSRCFLNHYDGYLGSLDGPSHANLLGKNCDKREQYAWSPKQSLEMFDAHLNYVEKENIGSTGTILPLYKRRAQFYTNNNSLDKTRTDRSPLKDITPSVQKKISVAQPISKKQFSHHTSAFQPDSNTSGQKSNSLLKNFR